MQNFPQSYAVMRANKGEIYPAFLNAANEIAVLLSYATASVFLIEMVERTMSKIKFI